MYKDIFGDNDVPLVRNARSSSRHRLELFIFTLVAVVTGAAVLVMVVIWMHVPYANGNIQVNIIEW
jgi:hypothetical protein